MCLISGSLEKQIITLLVFRWPNIHHQYFFMDLQYISPPIILYSRIENFLSASSIVSLIVTEEKSTLSWKEELIG